MARPKLSVVMTLYNKGPFVEEAIGSVLDGSFRDLELIVVDDASTDDGVLRVSRFMDERIHILSSERNTGRGASANRGFRAATGEYVAVLDADDIAHPERFTKQVGFLDAHQEVGACGSWAGIIGTRAHTAKWPSTDEEARAQLLFGDPMLYGASMFRRSVLERYEVRCREDWLRPGMDYLFLVDVALCTRMANLPETLTNYRIGPNNFLHGRDLLDDRAHTFAEAFRVLGLPATDEQVDLHLMLERRFRSEPEPSTVRALFAWAEVLRIWNRGRGHFPIERFEERLDHDLARLYYVFADKWPRCAIEHLRLSGGLPGHRLMYLLKTQVRGRWKGRG